MFLIQNKIRRGVPPISVSLSAPGPLVSALPSPGMPRFALGQHDHAPHPRHKGAGRPRRCLKRQRRHRSEAAPPPRYWSTSRPRVSEHATPSSPPGRALPPPVRSLCSPLIHHRASLLSTATWSGCRLAHLSSFFTQISIGSSSIIYPRVGEVPTITPVRSRAPSSERSCFRCQPSPVRPRTTGT
jgi:hypothetical protein